MSPTCSFEPFIKPSSTIYQTLRHSAKCIIQFFVVFFSHNKTNIRDIRLEDTLEVPKQKACTLLNMVWKTVRFKLKSASISQYLHVHTNVLRKTHILKRRHYARVTGILISMQINAARRSKIKSSPLQREPVVSGNLLRLGFWEMACTRTHIWRAEFLTFSVCERGQFSLFFCFFKAIVLLYYVALLSHRTYQSLMPPFVNLF